MNRAAPVGLNAIPQQITRRDGCRIRCGIIQHIPHRILQRCAPLRVIMLVLCVHGAERCDRRTEQCGIVVPALKSITRSACRLHHKIRIFHRISCHTAVRVHCRRSGQCPVIQIPLYRIAYRVAPFRINRMVLRADRVNGPDRSRKTRVSVPAFKDIPCPNRCLQRDVRIRDPEAVRIRRGIARSMPCRGIIVQMIVNRIWERSAPLRIIVGRIRVALRCINHCRRRNGQCGVGKPALKGIPRPVRRCECVIRRLNRIPRKPCIRIARRVSGRCRII